MSGSSISAIIASLALVVLILGFLFGWMRGYQKSLTRLIIVLIVAVAAFFITPLFTDAVLGFNISGFNIRINGELMTSVKQFITTMLNSVEEVREALEASPTLEAFILALPAMIVNTILFVIIFFLLKWISMAIYAIFAFTIFSKKKMENKNKIKLLGAGIGVVQSLIVILVMLVPIFGYVAIGSNLAESASAVSSTSYSATSTSAENTASMPKISLDEATGYVTKYTTAFDNTWVVKMYRVFGADKLSIAVFNELSKQNVNGTETNLSKELTIASKLIPIASKYANTNTIEVNSKLTADMADAIKIVYGEKAEDKTVMGQIINEVAKHAATKLANDEEFLHIKISNFTTDEKIVDIIKTACTAIKNTDSINLKSDLLAGVNTLSALVNNGVVEAVKNAEDVKAAIIDILADNTKTLVADVINAMAESSIATSVMPKIINTGLDYVYDTLSIDTSSNPDEYKIDDVIEPSVWQADSSKIQAVFANVASVYSAYDNRETANAIEVIDFAKIGVALDSMRKSEIFSTPGKNILNALLSSDMIDGIVPTDTISSLVAAWDKEEGDDGYINYASTFEGLGKMVKAASAISNISETADTKKAISDALNAITGEGVDGAIVEEILSSENLQNAGLSEDTASAVSEVVSEITSSLSGMGDEQKAKEINGIATALDIINETQQTESGTISTIDSEKAEEIVNAISESTIIMDLIENSSNVNGAVDTNKLDSGTKGNLGSAIDNNDSLNADQKAALKAMLGIS